MPPHSVINPLAILASKSKTNVFENPFSKAHTVHHNPLEKYKQTIDDLVAVAAKPAYEYYYKLPTNTKDRCEGMDGTIRDIVNIYMTGQPDTRQFISDHVSDTIISSCKKHGIMSVQRMSSVMDENRESIQARLNKLKKTGGGTRKSSRRRSRTRRYRR